MFEIMGTDGGALRAFYADLFGWEIDADNPMDYGFVEPTRNKGIGGGIGVLPEGYPGHVTVYVEVPDVEDALLRAEELGATRVMGPENIMDRVDVGHFADPEGHIIGLITFKPAAQNGQAGQ
jgi:predicted enzyme related to lactoylglutathione lyase